MKFRHKVLVVNLIMMSIAIGIVGYLMLKRNFSLAMNTLTESAIVENNLVQTYTEYGLLESIAGDLSEEELLDEIKEIGEKIGGGFLSEDTDFYILYKGKLVYGGEGYKFIPSMVLTKRERVSKKYCIHMSNGIHYIYVVASNELRDGYIQIATRTNVEEAYRMLDEQMGYFRILLLVILASSGVIMYIFAMVLTHPLEKLNRASKEMMMGNYKMRAKVSSDDEVGQLARSFNSMANAVDEHIDDLQLQIKNREQFVADFTHEIKTPLTSIIGYADTMRSIDLPKEQQIEALNYIVSAGKRLENMSGKLFELIYLNRNEVECEMIEITKLAAEIERYASPSLANKNMILKSEVEEGTIYGNKDLLVTAFSNFIDNARKASKEGGTIYLYGTYKEGRYILSVKDTGIGIKKEDIEKITNEFYMVDKSRSRMEGSAGLGLSLAALICKKHNAILSFDSLEGVGTSVNVSFGLEKKYETGKKD